MRLVCIAFVFASPLLFSVAFAFLSLFMFAHVYFKLIHCVHLIVLAKVMYFSFTSRQLHHLICNRCNKSFAFGRRHLNKYSLFMRYFNRANAADLILVPDEKKNCII